MDGYDYKKGRYSLRDFRLTGKKNEVIIQQHKTGTYECNYEKLKIKLIGLPFEIKEIEVDNVVLDFKELQYEKNERVFLAPKNFTEIHILG